MTPKEQLLLEIEQVPDSVIELVLDWLRSLKQLLQGQQAETTGQTANAVLLEAQPKAAETMLGVEALEAEQIGGKDVFPSFFKTLDRLHAEIPDSEWEKIPPDLSKHFDHYLYGGPKDEE